MHSVQNYPTQLIFPIAPGNYSAINAGLGGAKLNYYLQGMPVVIDPTPNQITQSALSNPYLCVSSHSLHVSGTVNTNDAYYCQNNRGLTTTVTYGSTNLYFSGGILIGKFPPDSFVPATVPCLGPWVSANVGGNSGVRAMYQDVTYQIGQGTGNIQFYYDTSDNNSASDRANGNPPGDPCRFQFIYNGAVVWDSDWRGFDTSAGEVTELSTSLAYYAGNPTWCPTIPSVKIVNGPTPTYVLLQPSTPTVAYNKTDTVGSTITVRSIVPMENAFHYTMSCPGGVLATPPVVYTPPPPVQQTFIAAVAQLVHTGTSDDYYVSINGTRVNTAIGNPGTSNNNIYYYGASGKFVSQTSLYSNYGSNNTLAVVTLYSGNNTMGLSPLPSPSHTSTYTLNIYRAVVTASNGNIVSSTLYSSQAVTIGAGVSHTFSFPVTFI